MIRFGVGRLGVLTTFGGREICIGVGWDSYWEMGVKQREVLVYLLVMQVRFVWSGRM